MYNKLQEVAAEEESDNEQEEAKMAIESMGMRSGAAMKKPAMKAKKKDEFTTKLYNVSKTNTKAFVKKEQRWNRLSIY